LDRPQHAGRTVLRVVDKMPFRKWANYQAYGAMGIDMVRAVLRIVFYHENSRLRPVLTSSHCFHELTESQVIAGYASLRRVSVGARALRMIFAQAHDNEARQSAFFLVLLKFFQEDPDAVRVSYSRTWRFRKSVIG